MCRETIYSRKEMHTFDTRPSDANAIPPITLYRRSITAFGIREGYAKA